VSFAGPPRIHRDHMIAGLRGLVAALALGATCLFWIASGWPDGAQAATLAAVACCFTASQDDPVPSLVGLLFAVLLSSLFAAIGQFAVFPEATNFEMVVLAMAAFFVPVGTLATIPPLQKLAALTIFTSTLLALQESYSADFAAWGNGTAAALLGVGTATAVSAVAVPAAATISLQSRLRAGWSDLAAAARSENVPGRLRMAELFLDRMGLVAPLLAASPPGDQVTAVATMQDVRVGINIVDLHAMRHDMPPLLGHSIDAVLREAGNHFAARAARGQALAPPDIFLHAIDRALDDTIELSGPLVRATVRALVGLRRNVFNDAPAYSPPESAALQEGGAPQPVQHAEPGAAA
jgi:uncharacterized membrane protein YccC